MMMMNLWMLTLVMTTDYSHMGSQSGMNRKRAHRHALGFRHSHPLYQTQSLPLTRTSPKMNSHPISSYVAPADCPVNPSIFVSSLLHGETAQGFWTASYVPQTTRSGSLVKYNFKSHEVVPYAMHECCDTYVEWWLMARCNTGAIRSGGER